MVAGAIGPILEVVEPIQPANKDKHEVVLIPYHPVVAVPVVASALRI